MGKTGDLEDKTYWAIGGTTLIGVGVGFFLFHISVFWFVASILIGIGLGLLIVAIMSCKKN
jgi:purine-cytosine permease-like protein